MWDEKKYLRLLEVYENQLHDGMKTPSTLLNLYKYAIAREDYEAAKAITEALKPYGVQTSDTHFQIKELNR